MQTNPGQCARSWLRSVLASCRSIHLARPHIVVPSASSSQQPLRNLILGAQPEACTTTKHHHENHLISVRPRLLTRHTVTRCSAALTQMQQISSDPRLGNEDGTLAGMALLCVPRVISLWVRGSGRTLTTRSDEATAKAERRGRTADPSKNSIEILLHKNIDGSSKLGDIDLASSQYELYGEK